MIVAVRPRDIVGAGGGGKGGDGGGSATESPDSLHSITKARTLDLISTGEIWGLKNGLQSIFLDGTPLQNPDGTLNFGGVTVDFRAGTQTQDPIAGFPSVESEIGIGVELKSSDPWVRSITNTQLSAARVRLSVQGLSKSDATSGINGYRVEYAIDVATDNGVYVQVLQEAFDGKTSQTYERSRRIPLPPASIGWSIRVRRLTPNANSTAVADRTNIVSITEIIDAKFRYPMAALIGLQLDASQFQNVPTRSYLIRGKLVRVPTNYDAETRTYSGPWDGTFKIAYTNNPAWILYEILLNDIFGLGRRITAAQVDKYELYRIAQYCDDFVPDGKGGLEPRFTCNMYLQTRVPAYKLIQDIAAIFHGVAYWAGGKIIVSADMPSDSAWTYTGGNVIGGKFTRSGSPASKRYTVALVSWNDNTDGGRQKVEAVIDREGIRRYGVQQIELAPVGCTSQGQAHRHGDWALLTSRLEKELITFSVGLDFLRSSPGRVIRVVDPARAGRRNGGRIRSAAGRTVTIDKAPIIAAGDKLTCILPTAVPETRVVESVMGDTVTVTADWSVTPAAESIWSVDNVDLVAQTFRVLSVKDKGDLTYEITAIQHEPGKFAYIDNGTRIEAPPTTVIPPSVQPPPASVAIDSYEVIDQGIATSVMSISWPAAASAIAYAAEWKKDDGNWISLPRTGQLTVDVPGIYAGKYNARVRAINPLEVRSAATYAAETQLNGKTTPPPSVTTLMTTALTFGIGLNWGFPAQGASDTQRTEIWYSLTPDRDSAIKLGDFAYPQNTHLLMGLAPGKSFFFWARLVDRSENEGPFYPAGAGVDGHVSVDATELLGALSGQISKEQLTQQLAGQIDLIENVGDLLDALPDAATVNQMIARQSAAEGDQDALAASQLIALNTADSSDARVRQLLRAKFEQAQAQIVEESHVRATETSALAEKTTQLTASLGDTSAFVEEVSQALVDLDGNVSANWSVKTGVTVDGKRYMAGLGAGVEQTEEGIQTSVYALADRFAILNLANGQIVSPFVIQNGVAIINEAVIGMATITAGKFVDWLESVAKNPDGVPVLRLNFKTGEIQLNGTTSSGEKLLINNRNIQVFNAAGKLKVRLGIWD
ncbi:host specificity protein J [Herbaspirillum sp. NPDC101397]|uniref:host specificity protein J n=1 Tax=Herbaspirillum sp. NPDC101397 TaxID=3364006 RepID=UPI00383B4245